MLIALTVTSPGNAVLYAQSTSTLKALTVEDGLSQGFITAISQDREGFLPDRHPQWPEPLRWQEVQDFTYDPADPFSISGNRIASVTDVGDYLLIGTQDQGLNVFDKKTQRFFVPKLTGPDSLIFRTASFPKTVVDGNVRSRCISQAR
ncbi:MAG: hypothetical protein IPK76_03025 [Lewinellaceae bacterium]|nr:hypothetical protein [Lewinellaceae bacterium]